MDTGKEAAMCVHRTDGSEMKFVEHPCGLYILTRRLSLVVKVLTSTLWCPP
jgi:hypothetical protein